MDYVKQLALKTPENLLSAQYKPVSTIPAKAC